MLDLYAWTKVIFPARIDNLVAGALWGVVCAVALVVSRLMWKSAERIFRLVSNTLLTRPT
jgi:hypothetical protein